MSDTHFPTIEQLAVMLRPPKLAYCDYIANRIQSDLSLYDSRRILAEVGRVKADLHPEGGYLLTTKKTIEVTDFQGKAYRVTIEEIEPKAGERE